VPIVLSAQTVAGAQNLLSTPQPADDDLFNVLDGIQDRRELAVLIVDPWAAQLPEYKQLLARLNGRRYGNTAIVVPWDDAEPDAAIRDGLYLILENWTDTGAHTFRDDIRSMTEFETKLGQVLVAVRQRVLRKFKVARRVLEAGPTSRPQLTGPGS
jgi:FxsC-like protein